ncbi:carboxymuconolactone decarboxylase family protein [Aeromicrobium sp. Marseille-Q0843]|uniref:Carboxymuconolactone decarboxylase family protein n=1 Tax=Aeromicrobium phoceense TaxID=2754045 RepID=A0A838XLC9_9ACTN|nr:carboxymuconolactone decarboxylase family protein [Aeromicrobium phoceense]MBA4609588.1 carboxymuconolactone decarboxylase family protein [Aeromicrobium phoceense]
MTSSFRIPAAPMTSPVARAVSAAARRMYGRVPDLVPVMWHHPKLLRSVLAWERRVGAWDALDPHLKSFAVMASAASIGCSWCLDFGYYLAHDEGLDERKVREVPRWRDSDVFTPLERDVMAYAEAMTATPPTVTDEQVASLREALGDAALVELTMMVAVENQRSRFNSAAGLASQGFSDVCELPLVEGPKAEAQ